jgi:hypothetical protein
VQGVFLWVVLLLKLLEEELANREATVSTAHVNKILDSAPAELEDFIVQTVERIPSHNRANALLLLAMALTMVGMPLNTKTRPERPWFSLRHFPIKWVNYYLTLVGISLYSEPFLLGVTPHCRSMDSLRRDNGALLLNSWCRGLLTADNSFTLFSHRSIPELLHGVLQRGAEPRITQESVSEAILELTLAEVKYQEELGRSLSWDRINAIACLQTIRDPTQHSFVLLHSIEEVAKRLFFGLEHSDLDWVRPISLMSLSQHSPPFFASILNAAARFALQEYVLWEISNHFSFPGDKNGMEVLLAYATLGAITLESDMSDFKCIVESCVRKWKDASPQAPMPFPWTLTWLDFINGFLFQMTPFVSPMSVGWSLLEYWLELSLTSPFVLTIDQRRNDTPRTVSVESYPLSSEGNPLPIDKYSCAVTSPNPVELRHLRDMTYIRNFLTSLTRTNEEKFCQPFLDFVFAAKHRNRLALRDLVLFHGPLNGCRLLELLDGNTNADTILDVFTDDVVAIDDVPSWARNPFREIVVLVPTDAQDAEVESGEEAKAAPLPMIKRPWSGTLRHRLLGKILV